MRGTALTAAREGSSLTDDVRHEGFAGDIDRASQARAAAASHARVILFVVIAAAFLDVVDFSVVQVALPTIQREFLAPLAESQWVTGVYGLTLAGFLMVSGRAGDVYGQKRMFVIGIVLFTASSLSAGLASSLLSLIVSRAIQGIAAAMTTATALAILAVTVTAGLILLVYAFTIAATDGLFTVQAALPLGLSVLGLAAFLAIEYRSKAPLMPLAFLRRRTTLTANVLSLVVSSSAGALIVLTVYLQQILGFSPLYAGLAFLPPAAIFFFVGGWGAPWLLNRIGMKRVLVASSTLVTLGLALLAPLPVASGYFGILPGTVVWALGASIGFPALAIAGLAGTKPGEEGLASGLIQTSQRLGFPLGLSALLTVASVFDPQLGLTGYRYAFMGAAIVSALGIGIALQLPGERAPMAGEDGTPNADFLGEGGEVE